MPNTTFLEQTLSIAIDARLGRGDKLLTQDLHSPPPSSAPDFFSNDFLSLTSDSRLRDMVLQDLSREPFILGSTGSRILTGNTVAHIDFEKRMMSFFGASAALLCNSGYDANTAFFASIPQRGDVIVFDELIHASVRDGMSSSRAGGALYAFAHNSPQGLREVLVLVLRDHPKVLEGQATLFVAVESLYSMDGDFSPLVEIVDTVKELVPPSSTHIVVDEAHSTGIIGEEGRGYVSLLGLENEIHTVMHTFGKGRSFSGAVILTTPLVRQYLINYGRPLIYSTSLPYANVIALNSIFTFISMPAGKELAQQMQDNCRYFEHRLTKMFRTSGLLTVPAKERPRGIPSDLCSPIFGILTPGADSLAQFLRSFGYAASGITYPVVPKGQERLRVVVHAGNTQDEMDELIVKIDEWCSSNGEGPSRAML